jgi:O-acetyl-ADP-ribose deacetylase (regulator of RNase III)
VSASLTYVIGDATRPGVEGPKFIAHVVNDVRAWGAGFVLAISARWRSPEAAYKRWPRPGMSDAPFELGNVQLVEVEPELYVANLLAQTGLRGNYDEIPLRYDALDRCLQKLGQVVKPTGGTVHMPRIGCGLAGGTWDKVEPLIQKNLVDQGVYTFVYDLPPRR